MKSRPVCPLSQKGKQPVAKVNHLMSMRILMSSTAGAGHVSPLIPFAEACVRAGNELRIAVPDKALPIVEGAGLAGLPVGYPPEEETGPIWERVERASPDQKEEIVIHEVFGRLYTRAALPGNAHRGGNLAPGPDHRRVG